MTRQDEEETDAFLRRLWSSTHAGCPDAGRTWNELSEILHGRGPLLGAVQFDSRDLATRSEATSFIEEVGVVRDAVILALTQVRHCVATLGTSNGMPVKWGNLIAYMPAEFPLHHAFYELGPALYPLTFGVVKQFGPETVSKGNQYSSDVFALASSSTPLPMHYSERTLNSWIWRRSRAFETAQFAFDSEIVTLGDAFNPANLERREFTYVLISESCGLVANWLPAPLSSAFNVASGALRAAFWLWLEDDERAMMLARSVLEQTARARTWRIKPDKARRLEDRGATTTNRDWLDASGWRRLSALNRSLGEFSHTTTDARWSTARETLDLIQPPSEALNLGESIQTARGAALNSVAYLLGHELMQHASGLSPELVDSFSEFMPLGTDEAGEQEINRWLDRVWEFRGRERGPRDFTSPTEVV